MNKYQEALDFIVKNSCPTHNCCSECNIKKSCNCEAKEYIDVLQKLIDKSDRSLIEIKVRDKADGKIHTVGESYHDCLLVEDGKVEYYNLQNGEGTGGDYEFVEKGLYDEYD